MDGSSRERTTVQAALPLSAATIPEEPRVEVARAVRPIDHLEYEAATRQGGVEAVRAAVRKTRLSITLASAVGGMERSDDSNKSGSLKGSNTSSPRNLCKGGPASNTTEITTDSIPELQLLTSNLKGEDSEFGSLARAQEMEPASVARVDIHHNEYQVAKRESIAALTESQIRANVLKNATLQGGRRPSVTRTKLDPSVVDSQSSSLMSLEPTVIARMDSHEEYQAAKRESSSNISLETPVPAGVHHGIAKKRRSGVVPRRSCSGDDPAFSNSRRLNPRRSLSGDGAIRNNQNLEPPTMVGVQAGATDNVEMDSSRKGRSKGSSSALRRNGIETITWVRNKGRETPPRPNKIQPNRRIADMNSSTISKDLGSKGSSTAVRRKGIDTISWVRVSREKTPSQSKRQADQQIKAGLRNSSRNIPGATGVGPGNRDGYMTPPKPTQASAISKNQLQADDRLKAGLRQSRTSVVARAMNSETANPQTIDSTGTQPEKESRVGAFRHANPTRLFERENSVDSDTRLKAGLRNIRPASFVGARSVSGGSNFPSSSTMGSQMENDARIKAGLRTSRISIASDDSECPPRPTSQGSLMIEEDARARLGVRQSSRSPMKVPGLARSDSRTPGAHSSSGLRLSDQEVSKFGMRAPSMSPGASPGFQLTQEELDKFERHYENGDNNASRSTGSNTDRPQCRTSPGRRPRNSLTEIISARDLRPSYRIPPVASPHATHYMDSTDRDDIEIMVAGEGHITRDDVDMRDVDIEVAGPAQSVGIVHGTELAEAYVETYASPDAHTQMNTTKRKRTTRWMFFFLILVIIGIVTGAVVGLTSSNNSGGEGIVESSSGGVLQPELETKPTESVDIIPILQVFPTTELPSKTIQAIQSQRERLPQVRAYKWLVDDPNLTEYSESQRLQRFALAAFYYGTNGEEWLEDASRNNWLDYETHECDWYTTALKQGYTVCNGYNNSSLFTHYDYSSLVLSGRPRVGDIELLERIRGVLVPEIALLKKLVVLDCGYQNLRGSIPTELESLSSTLSRIVLYENDLTGLVPEQLFVFAQDLWLSHNPLAKSTIPSAIGLNTKLQSLLMIDSKLTGVIPPELFQVRSNFQVLLLEMNDLEGQIPTECGRATSLKALQLSRTRLSGSMPSELGLLSRLTSLDLALNQLDGRIVSELGNLETLETLILQGNRLQGTLPVELARLRQLQQLKISSRDGRMRDLTGVIPIEYFILPAVDAGNRARGLQTSVGEDSTPNATSDVTDGLQQVTNAPTPTFPNMRHFWIEDTDLDGTVPPEIGWMTNLETIRFGWNKQTSPRAIPTELGLLSNTLTEISLAGIQLQSTIPSELGRLTRLAELRLQDNALTGTLPTSLQQLGLSWFEVHGNGNLGGSIPASLCGVEPKMFGCPQDPLRGAKETSLCGCHCGPCD